MNQVISNAKVGMSKAVEAAKCHLALAKAAYRYSAVEARFNKLHPVRNLREREVAGRELLALELAFSLATKKLKSI